VKGKFWEIVNLLDNDTESQRDLITIELVPYVFTCFYRLLAELDYDLSFS